MRHTMAEDKFLAFKGLKQYDPDSGWASVDSNASNSEHREDIQQTYQNSQEERVHDLYIDPDFEQDFNDLSLSSHSNYQTSSNSTSNDRGHNSFNEYPHPRDSEINARTNRSFKENTQDELNLSDPLLSELFEQLNQPPQDELTQNWKIIATSVNILTQRMAQRKDLQERLRKLDSELETLRSSILQDLEDIQKAADQQLSMARLRAEVSTLAQARLAARLRRNNT